MADFTRALLHTIQHEGGYVNDQNDNGGETKYGISSRSYPDVDIKNLTFAQASAIYQRDYWHPLQLDLVEDERLAEQIFDCAVHCGQRTAIRLLQEAYNLISRRGLWVDGIIGPKTLNAINDIDIGDDLLGSYKVMRGRHYVTIVRQDITQEKYFLGWLRRIDI